MMKDVFLNIYNTSRLVEVCYLDLFIICAKKTMSNNETVTTLERLANLLRIHSVESTQAANSGLDRLILYLFIFIYLFIRII